MDTCRNNRDPNRGKNYLIWRFYCGYLWVTCFLWVKSLPPPVQDFRHWEPAGMGEFTCGFFHRFPMGTICTPERIDTTGFGLNLSPYSSLGVDAKPPFALRTNISMQTTK